MNMGIYQMIEPLASGKHTKSSWKWPFIVDLSIDSMVIFHSYVSLPEGKMIEPLSVKKNDLQLPIPGKK